MKRFLCFLMIICMMLSLFAGVSQAETIVERVEALESAIGLGEGSGVLDARISYLEQQLGIVSSEGTSVDERLRKLEETLGLGTSSTAQIQQDSGANDNIRYDNATHDEPVSLAGMDYFQIENFTVDNSGTDWYEDNYGNVYPNVFFHRGVNSGYVEYYLNGAYSELAGTICVYCRAVNNGYGHTWDTATIRIYGDDQLLYSKCGGFDPKFKPMEILLNINGVEFLRIEMENNVYYDTGLDKQLIMFCGVTVAKEPSQGSYENHDVETTAIPETTVTAELVSGWPAVLDKIESYFTYDGVRIDDLTEQQAHSIFERAGVSYYTQGDSIYYSFKSDERTWWAGDNIDYRESNVCFESNPLIDRKNALWWDYFQESSSRSQVNSMLPDNCPVKLGDSFTEFCSALGITDQMFQELVEKEDIRFETDLVSYDKSTSGTVTIYIFKGPSMYSFTISPEGFLDRIDVLNR